MMIDGQRQCLVALGDTTAPNGEWCATFASIVASTGMDRKTVRRHVRALARKGLAEYYRGLWDEDGNPRGAGYCITEAGQDWLATHPTQETDHDRP